ncbi:S1 RNA-binding domain-containing protein [Bdellovibrionota bacterium FG-1]
MIDQFDNGDSGDDGEEKVKKSNEFAHMLEASFKTQQKRLSVGDKIQAEILVTGKEDIFVSTGTMNDGVVSRRELLNQDGLFTYKQGDILSLYVTQVRGTEIFLSPKATSKNLAGDLEDAFDMMMPIEGRVVEVVKGGFRVSIKGKLAFCPVSHLDSKHIDNLEDYIGKKFEFRITKFEEGGRNIVVSRRKILEDERELSMGNFTTEHKAGDVVPGKIARLEKFGAFVELAPGMDGLVHVSEIAWSRVNDPAEVLRVGDPVQVKILKMENPDGKFRISLSIKQAGAGTDPWTLASQKFPVGTILSGKVERREAYGLFIRLDDCITGLLPKSKALESPEFAFDKFKVGDSVTIQVSELRTDEHRISLCVPRDPGADDWKGFVASGSNHELGTLGGALGAQLKAALEKKRK